jgi:2-keto-4-pentenoate hydratase/2-oxohepta-3-ene-1,7-dioic acid hydratase in catechol pathway
MRVARVFHPASPCPLVALERDGSLYDVAELDRQFGTPPSQRVPFDKSDFHLRVFALRCVGLEKLDDHLRGGDRPTEARLSKGSLLWLPPCSAERALYVQIDHLPPLDAVNDFPQYHLGNARTLFAHQETVPFPHDEPHPEAEVVIAALIGEELRAASVQEVEEAIVGYSILIRWVAPLAEKRSGWTHGRNFATSLGPFLVTKDEAGSIDALRLRLRVAGEARDLNPERSSAWTLSDAIAHISRHVPLMPGDVVGSAPLTGVRAALRDLGLSFGMTLEVAVERLGKIASRPVLGPEISPVRPGERLSKTTSETDPDHRG